jgi:hypothetical protein
MVTLQDGPGKGTLALHRAPRFLRVVIDPEGRVDALDQLDDEPGPGEAIHVYERTELRGAVHLLTGNRGRGGSGWYPSATYHHRHDVDGERLRDTTAWRTWAAAEAHGPRLFA